MPQETYYARIVLDALLKTIGKQVKLTDKDNNLIQEKQF